MRGETRRCLRASCRRILRAPASVAWGYGPRCWSRVEKAALVLERSGSAPAGKAATLLREATPVPTPLPGVYQIPSRSEEGRLWTADRYGCNCPAGRVSALCYHRVAVEILVA